jgi:hypothetical protein
MCITYAKVMIRVKDDSMIANIGENSKEVFTQDMIRKLTVAVP